MKRAILPFLLFWCLVGSMAANYMQYMSHRNRRQDVRDWAAVAYQHGFYTCGQPFNGDVYLYNMNFSVESVMQAYDGAWHK